MPLPGPPCSRQRSRTCGRKRSKWDSKYATSPNTPSASKAFSVRKSLSQRRLWNTDSTRPRLRASASSSRACDSVTVKGLSTTTCLPASSAAFANGKCVSLGVGITIRSIFGSLKRCFGSATTATVGQSAFTFASSLLETAASSRPGVPTIRGAWKVLLA